jgi:hypothetical protein
MATYFARKAGNINASDVWATTPSGTAGAVTFASGDVLMANSFAITVNVSTDLGAIGEVRTDTQNGATNGGSFILSNDVTLTANSFPGTLNAGAVVFSGAAGTSASIVGNVNGGVTNANGARNVSTGTLNITGNCIGGNGSGGEGVRNISTGTLNITGNCIGDAASGAQNASTGTLNITGNCVANANVGAANNSTGTMLVVGTIEASEFIGGVGGANRGQITLLTGPFLTSPTFGVNPIGCNAWRWASTLNTSTFIEVPTSDLLAKRNLVTADNVTGMPDEADVKDGVVYGPASELTGTFEQTVAPSASDIATAVWGAASRTITGGVVDTLTNAPASVTPSDIWSHSSRTITGGTVDTLTNAPTVPSASAIADEVRVELATELARIDAPISGAGNAPSASTVATAVRTELATELARVDAAVSTRLADADYVAPANSDVAAVKAITDALVVERLNNTATTAIVGNLIAQANS